MINSNACFAYFNKIRGILIERAITGIEGKWISFMRANRREADDISIRADAGRDAFTEFQQHARSVLVGIGDFEWFVWLEIPHVCDAVGRVIYARWRRSSLALRRERRAQS